MDKYDYRTCSICEKSWGIQWMYKCHVKGCDYMECYSCENNHEESEWADLHVEINDDPKFIKDFGHCNKNEKGICMNHSHINCPKCIQKLLRVEK